MTPSVSQILPSEHRLRLFWSLQDRLEDSVMIMRGKYSPDPPLEKYYQRPLDDSSEAGWHPISHEPVTTPPVQTLNVEVYQLAEWAESWAELPGEDLDSRVFQDKDGNETSEEEDGEGNPNKLIRCCGYDRPPENTIIEVCASGKQRDYVSIHDYLTTLPPWLRSRRDDILLAISPESEFTEPLPSETELVVLNYSANLLMIDKMEEWKAMLRAAANTEG